MIPYLVTPPASVPVDLSEMKDYRRAIGYTDDDVQLDALQASAVAYLDGWGGVLGRCIMPQTWAVDVTGPGEYVLPFPDASGVTVDSGTVSTRPSGAGVVAVISDIESDQDVTITAEYGLSAQRLPAAKQLVKLLCGNWFEYREGISEKNMAVLPFGIQSLISSLRWNPV